MELYELANAESKTGKVECIHSSGDTLFVGTSDGHLLCYTVTTETNMGEITYNVTGKARTNIGKTKKIQDVQSDSAVGVLFVLHSGFIDMLKFDTLDFITRIKESAGASVFTIDKKKRQTRLIMAVGRKVTMVFYDATQYTKFEDINLPDTPLTMKWIGDTICLGYKNQYSLIKTDSPTQKTDLPFEKNDQPVMELLDDEILLRSGNAGVYIHMTGQNCMLPSSRSAVSWPTPPFKLAISFPFIAGLAQNSIEIFDMYSELLINSISFKNAKFICGDSKYVFVATQGKIFILVHQPIEKFVEFLIEHNKCSQAFELVDKTFQGSVKEKSSLIEKMLEESGFSCLFAIELESALNYLMDSFVDVREVLIYFQELAPYGYKPSRKFKGFLRQQYKMEKKLAEKEVDSIMMEAKQYLITYLKEKRRPYKNNEEQAAIDFALVKLYMEIGDEEELNNILDNENNLSLGLGESLFTQLKKYLYLARFYRGKSNIDKSLELLKAIGDGVYLDDKKKAVSLVVDILSSEKQSYVWNFAKWVISKDHALGLKIFTFRKTKLDSDLVIKYMKESLVNPAAFIQEYLEYLVVVEKNTDVKYHTSLALQYIERILYRSEPVKSESLMSETLALNGDVQVTSSDFILQQQLRYKLIVFLANSQYYQSDVILERIRETDLNDEKIILMSKLDDHSNVLKLLFQAKNLKGVENYCLAKSHLGDCHFKNSTQSTVFVEMVRVCFESEEVDLKDFAMVMLNKYPKLINPIQIMTILPSDLPASRIENFLTQSILTSQKLLREGQVVKNLVKIEKFQTEYSLKELHKRKVVITSKRNCRECGHVIGTSVFTVYPDMSVVHLYCLDGKKKRNIKEFGGFEE